MRGSTFQRCGCRDADGKQLGARCPRLGHKGHGTWWFRYDAPRGADGRRKQVKVGPFDSRRDAEAAMAAVLDRINKGTHVETDRGMTFGRYLDEWLAGKLRLRPSTRISYTHHVELYFKPGLGHIRLADLRDTDFEELYAAMRQIGRPLTGKPSPMLRRLLEARTDTKQARRPLTPKRVRQHPRHREERAERRGEAAEDRATTRCSTSSSSGPASRVRWSGPTSGSRSGGAPDKRPSPVMVWTPVQTGAFLDAVAEDRLYPMWHLIAFRGLRRSEAVWLAWSDVDLDRGDADRPPGRASRLGRTEEPTPANAPSCSTPAPSPSSASTARPRTRTGCSGARAGPRPGSSSPTRTDGR